MPPANPGPDIAKHVRLVTPGLLDSPGGVPHGNRSPAPELAIPYLETLLARSDRVAVRSAPDLERLLFDLFQIGVDSARDLPVAPVTRVTDLGVIDKGWWMRADPVHLRPAGDHLILADATILHITQDEADRLVAELMGVYAEDGWVLKTARPDRWYLKPPQVPDIQTAPLPMVVGRDVHAYLPQGKDAKAWHTILNEIQILLHTAPVNAERERQGQLPINSVWFWGGGPLPELKHVQWAKIWSTEPVSLALARLSETACAPVPAQAQEWLDQVDVPGEHLIVMDEGRGAVQYGDSERWIRFIQTLETEWIMPLLLALKKGRIHSLTVYTESVPGFALTAKHLRRWWRRRRSLLGYR